MNEDSFFSLDRFIEFGLGVSSANQMMKMMNESLHSMYVPGVDNALKQQSSLFYAIIEGVQSGPYSESKISRLIVEKRISNNTYVWKPGMTSWKLASEVPEILKLIALTPPQFIE